METALSEAKLERTSQLNTEDELFFPKSATRYNEMLYRALQDRYRCPDGFFNFARAGRSSGDSGYFRFGTDTICYGRPFSGTVTSRPESITYDAIREMRIERRQLSLPFDPTEVIDHLRLERYAYNSVGEDRFKKSLRRLYYLLRPLTNLTIRRHVQRFYARNWRKRLFPHWPVDTTVENICENLLLLSMRAKGIEKVPFVWFWPDGSNGCLAMTHDVETAFGRDCCAKLMNLDDSFGVKAAFGIVPEDRYEVPTHFLESIRSRGFEVTIQDLNHDGRLFDNREEFLRRAKVINQYAREFGARGFRAAVLYRKPEWYDALDFAFDMSFPNVAPLDPQQGGCCTVMPFFIGDMLELPVTTVQDYTLFHILNERSIDLWKAQTDMVLKKNGLLSFIVHPDYILQPDTLPVYKHLLRHLQGLRDRTPIWCALPSEINEWWRARNKMSVVKDGTSWRIVGEGSERAVLAYAKNVDGKIVYESSPSARPE